ncbi:hypothetical protein EPO34_02100 [Patescibacteria group bacterium]|nr:MAG: hypothetical protein EPO34_02100 [Patescibacteria group bacterium]
MGIYKQAKDHLVKFVLGSGVAPRGLVELNHYFRLYGRINFRHEKQEDGSVVAISEDFRYGSIITHADRADELDEKVKDAILTAFEVPSSYAKEAGVHRVGEKEYAFA